MSTTETGGLGELLAPLVSGALADAAVSQQLATLTAETLSSPEVDAAVNRLGLRVAAFAAVGVAVGVVGGLYLWRSL